MAKVMRKIQATKRNEERLGPGMHLCRVERRLGKSLEVRTADGVRHTAVLARGVDPSVADAALRSGSPVVIVDGSRGPEIAGALVTALPIAPDADGRVTVDAREIRLRAAESISIDVGDARLSADRAGVVRLEGDRMVIDMGALVRVLSSRVELP